MPWEIDSDHVESWLLALDQKSQVQVLAALDILAEEGPQLGRPLLDTISTSSHKNMKELRPGSSGRSEIRILFAFDPKRTAIMLLGGNKSQKWNKWYSTAVPEADKLFDQHLVKLEKQIKPKGGN